MVCMGFFKNRKNRDEEAIELDLAPENESTEEVSLDGGDDVFDGLEDSDAFFGSGMDALFSEYLGDDISLEDNVSDASDAPSEAFAEKSEEKAEDKVEEPVDEDNLFLDEDDFFAGFEDKAAEAVPVAEKEPENISTESENTSEELFAEIAETAAESEAPVAEEREKTTDEVIEEFIRSSALGIEFTGMMEDAGVVREDAVPEPVFERGEAEGEAELPVISEEDMSAPENIEDIDFNTPDTDGVGTTDMNLRIAFGLEEDIDDPDEVKDAVKKLGDHLESNKRVGKKYTPEHPEYTDPIQARDIAGEYKRRRKNVTMRLFFSVIFTLLLIFFENITVITELLTGSPKQFAGTLDPAKYPVVYVMVSLQLLFLAAVFALPELKRGFKRLFSAAPTPESITLLLVAAGAVSSAVIAYCAKGITEPVTFNAVSAVSVVMTLIYSRLNVKREMMTFFVVGSKKKKYAMSRVPDDESLLDPADYEDDMYGDVMRVERTGFVDGFFSRMGAPDGMTTAFVAGIMGVAVAAAILLGIFADRDGAGASSIASAAYLALLAMTPFAVHLTFSYPFYRAAKAAAECDSAIVGETSLDEYATTAVVSFDDGNVFPSFGVKVQNIKIYNNARIDRVLYYASSVFKGAGGPLSDVFEVATMEMGRSEDVEILDADRGYLAAKVDGVKIVFGSHAALPGKGYEIEDSIALDDVDFSDELSIMYMFREDMLIAKMYIKYVLDGDIESMLMQFQDYGMYVCVRTYDPNIDEDMIASKLTMRNPPIKVVRYRGADDVKGYVERVDSGFVTYSSPKTLLQLLPYCDKTIHTKRTCAALAIMSMIISLMLIAVFTMSSGLAFLRSVHVILWHICWMIPAYLASKIFIR